MISCVFLRVYVDPTISYAFMMHQVPGTRCLILVQKSFVRVHHYVLCTRYHIQVQKIKHGTRYELDITRRAFKPLFLIGSIQLYTRYIFLVGSPLFCAEEAFFTLSATTKTYQVQYIIHVIPGM